MIELCVCIGSSCHVKGSYNVIQTFQQLIEEKALHDKINFKSGFCMRQCEQCGVSVTVNGEQFHVLAENSQEFFRTRVEPKA